jgi:hypothetical protein
MFERDDQELIDWLAAKIQGSSPSTNGHVEREGSSLPFRSDEAIIERCRAASNAAKFADLFDHGDVHAHHGGDDSVADLALLSILGFYTQDEAQLERLFSSSALGRRDKWRRRPDYRERTIRKAVSGLRDTYQGGGEEVVLAAQPHIEKAADDSEAGEDGPKLELVCFAKRPSPTPREFIVPDLIPRHHPTTLYGWGGTAKSLIAILLSMSVAGGKERFFNRDVTVHGPVLYIDFELDADEQQRRVEQLAAGMKMEVPEDLFYVSALGFRTHDAIQFALSMCREYRMVMVVLDSLGPAMVGDMSAAKDVIEFHNHYIAPFKATGATPLLVDHQARQQAGEGYQAKGAFGSAYKEHLSRSLIQVEAGDRGADQGALNVRLRHKKTNFGALVEPFDVSLSFSDEMILATTRDLTPSDRAQEMTLNSKDRVKAALEDGPAYPDELAEITGLSRSTVKNAVTALKKSREVEITGEVQGQMEQVQLAASAALPYIEKAAKAGTSDDKVPLSPTPHEGSDSDDTNNMTVAGLFANPPEWLPRQLEVYREDPERHFEPLCVAVAAVVIGDGTRAPEVFEEVRRVLGKGRRP